MKNLLFVVFIISFSSFSQGILTNDDVVKLKNAGVSDDVVVTKILWSRTNFDTSKEGLAVLKSVNVSPKIIKIMSLYLYQNITLTNEDIVKLYEIGVDIPVIIEKIKTSYHRFDLRPNIIISLKTKIPDRLVIGMIENPFKLNR